jgi:hypothetical protein
VNRIPERNRPLVILSTGVIVLLLVAGGVLVLGQLGPSPTPPPSVSPSTPASPSADTGSPEGGVRAFFEAFARARRTDDPSLVLSSTTGEQSSAYRSVEAFLLGQKEEGKASITTVLELENFSVTTSGNTSTVVFDLTEGGYNINVDTGEPLESPEVLPPTRVTVELSLRDGDWLVDRYESSGP